MKRKSIWTQCRTQGRCLLCLLLMFMTVPQLSAQSISWTDVSAGMDFPESVRLFSGSRTSPVLKAFYLEIDLADTNIAVRSYLRSSPLNVKSFAAAEKALVALNGGYFGGSVSYSTVIHPGELKASNVPAVTRDGKSYPVIRSMFWLNTEFKPSVDWIYHFGSLPEQTYAFDAPIPYAYNDPTPASSPVASGGRALTDILTAVGGGPTLVKDGAKRITYNEEILWGSGVGLDNRDPRSAVGYRADGRIILLAADGRQSSSEGLSLTELADVMISLGCVEAMNLDGGGSTQMAAPASYINSPSETYRAVPSILAVTHRDSVRIPLSDAYELIMDTEDLWAKQEGSWFETANAGFWGQSKSLLSQSGDGSSRNIYDVSLREARRCELYAWWVASSNRCKDTPYIISHSEGIDTVRVDQSSGHAQWNYIGSYLFGTGRAQTVTVSNLAGPAGYYAVADAIRLLSEEGEIHPATATALEDPPPPALAENVLLLKAYPNPFNAACVLRAELPASDEMTLRIYDLNGRHVKTLQATYQNSEMQEFVWHADSHQGLKQSAGIYFAVLETPKIKTVKKLSLLY